MSAENQTSEELLLRYAAGRLRPAPAMVVESHLAMSASSRKLVAQYEGVGGALLEEESLAELPDDLFERTLALLDLPAPEQEAALVNSHEALDVGMAMPEPLARREIGPWRWIGPGMRFARVEVPEDPDHNVILLRVGPGTALPTHSHSGEELTLVLKGEFYDEGGRYRAGDLMLEDQDEGDHTPMVSDGGECICLIALEGQMKFKGFLARLIQPLHGL